jgi:hypothetical protein
MVENTLSMWIIKKQFAVSAAMSGEPQCLRHASLLEPSWWLITCKHNPPIWLCLMRLCPSQRLFATCCCSADGRPANC